MLARILVLIAALINYIVPTKPTTPYEAQVDSLIGRIDTASRTALDQSVVLQEAAADMLVKSQSTRAYSRKLSGLAGRLEGALSDT
jgi:hypothetical protein